MMESSYRRQFRPGESIFNQGDVVDGFYIVVSGECLVQATARAGQTPLMRWRWAAVVAAAMRTMTRKRTTTSSRSAKCPLYA